jgi:poly(3-hydroxybutyrate) depolymerase
MLHRDIKPSNILVNSSDDVLMVKLIDFGVARRARPRVNRGLTATAAILGTAAYMAPEQAFGEDVDARSDLYSVGLVLVEAVCGYAAVEDWQRSVIARHLMDSPPPQPPATLPSELWQVVTGLSAAYADDRFATAPAALESLGTGPPQTWDRQPPANGVAPTHAGAVRAIAIVVVTAALAAGLILTVSDGPEDESRVPPAYLVPGDRPTAVAPPRAPTLQAPVSEDLSPDDAGADMTEVTCSTELAEGEGWVTTGDAVEPVRMWGYVPKGYGTRAKNPVIVAFHDGESQSPPGVVEELNLYAAADELGALILAPAGHVPKRSLSDIVGQSRHSFSNYALKTRWSEVVEITLNSCGDPDRIFVYGDNVGASGAFRLGCMVQVAGTISWARRLAVDREMPCASPRVPGPHLILSPTRDPRYPLEGCYDCEGDFVSVQEHELRLREWNGCTTPGATEQAMAGARCRTWRSCEAPVFACRVDAGPNWPGFNGGRMAGELATDFPLNDVVIRFVETNGTEFLPIPRRAK